jgi:putative membrane protein
MMYGNWAGWGVMMFMPFLWVVLIGLTVWAVVALTRRPADRSVEAPRRETPQEILDRRFASGEIDADTYTQSRDRLAGRPS